MYHEHVEKLPASWAEVSSDRSTNGTNATNGTNGVNGAQNGTNGYSNGLSNGQFNGYTDKLAVDLPEKFIQDKCVRTVYGLVPLKFALDWPVFASYDEMAGCAAWMGGRIPTFEEAQSIYAYSDSLRREEAEKQLGKTVPAVNGFVIPDPFA